jgi:integrator complex subunit 1
MINNLRDVDNIFFQLLAEIFQDLLTNREEYLRGLRILLREIVRSVRQDMNFAEFALGLMKEKTESKFTDAEASFKVRNFLILCFFV